MRTLIAAVLLLSLHDLHAATLEIDLIAAALAGKEASFTQSFTPKGFRNAQTESGTVIFGALPMMRWSYHKPEEKLFVFDGRHSWLYLPADRQVTMGELDVSRKRDLPFLMLDDPKAREQHYSTKQRRRGDVMITTLQARDAGSTVRQVIVTTGAAEHLIQKVEYTDHEGNRTVFELTGYHPVHTSADSFRFIPPPGVQTINAG